MSVRTRLLFGPIAAVAFALGTIGVALFLPGYSHLRQDVSEIGALGTPTRLAFAALVYGVAACLLVFAWGLRDLGLARGLSPVPAYLIGFVVVSEIGIATFATPDPLHEPFGLLSLIGFQAPGMLALLWRRDRQLKRLVDVSRIFFFALWAATALILVPGFWPPLAVAMIPVAGLAQRTLFLAWFGWCAYVGISLRRSLAA